MRNFSGLIIGLFFVQAPATATTPLLTTNVYEVYMDDSGNDANLGTPAAPIKTLVRAHALVKEKLISTPNVHVKINIASGTYFNQTIRWTAIPKIGSLQLIGSALGRPVFDGRELPTDATAKIGYFINFAPQFSGATNIRVSNIIVQFYLEGISFLATNRNDLEAPITNNSIEKTAFKYIGNIYSIILDTDGTRKPGLAVVRLLNTRISNFRGNDFVNIRNDRGSGQHAFYVAHYSSENTFEGNRFTNVMSGSTIKIRDYSNDNYIVNNDFVNIWPVAIQVWHCEKADRTDCTKDIGESRSYNTEERNNLFYGFKPVEVYQERVGQYNPRPYTNGVYGVIRDSAVRTGVMIRSAYYSSTLYGLCGVGQTSSCVNTSGACYSTDSGSSHLWCTNTSWNICRITELGKIAGTRRCAQVAETDANWINRPDTGECVTQDTIRGGGQYPNASKAYCLELCKSFLASASRTARVYDCRLVTDTEDLVLLKGRAPY